MHEPNHLIRVLLVEDVEAIRRGLLLSTPWMDLGCMVVGDAADGEEALELYDRLRPQIVITDIRLPKMDGLTFIQKAKAIAPCEFLIISAYREISYAQTAIENACRAYLLKPVDTEVLHQTLREVVAEIRKQQADQQLLSYIDGSQSNELLRIVGMLSNEAQHSKYLIQAVHYIAEHCSEPLTVKTVADELNISDSYLTKLFKSETNYTFLKILTVFRVRRALELMDATNMKVYEIAEAVGYQDTRYFSMVFQKYIGQSPSQYRGDPNG